MKRSLVNDTAFDDPLSGEAKYWIGFLMADGCVRECRLKTVMIISLNLSAKDEDHIRKFCSFVGLPPSKIKSFTNQDRGFGGGDMYAVQFGSLRIAHQLIKYGVTPRKTYTAKVSDELVEDPDFWRGAIDGDGSLGVYRIRKYFTNYLTFCGSFNLVSQFSQFAGKFVKKPKVSKRKNIWVAVVTGKNCKELVQKIYTPGSISLDRKLEIATQMVTA